jgi:hypothetical protein
MEPTGIAAERNHQPVCLEHRKRIAAFKAFSLGAEAALSLRDPSERAGERAHKVDDIRVVYEPVKLTQEFRTFNFMSPWKDMLQLLGDEIAEPKEGEA